jgi:CHAD domain-containing protein
VNLALLPPGEQPAAPHLPEWRQRLEAWRASLSQCARKPSRKSVHVLRTLTLRLRAGLEHSLEQAADPATERAFQRWSKDAKKLRKALEPVRNADVYLDRLDSIRDSHGKTPESESRLSPLCAREIAKLQDRLLRKRMTGIDKLRLFIGAHGKRLNRLSNEMEAALEPAMPAQAPSTAQAALDIFAHVAKELPSLDAGNLHEYRKRLKQALYLAELSAASDPVAERLTAAFRKIQDAAGEWHDWHALALEAGRFLRGHGKRDGLLSILKAREDQALQRALGQCRRSTARSIKNAGKLRLSLPKKPVTAERGLQLDDDDLEAQICR